MKVRCQCQRTEGKTKQELTVYKWRERMVRAFWKSGDCPTFWGARNTEQTRRGRGCGRTCVHFNPEREKWPILSILFSWSDRPHQCPLLPPETRGWPWKTFRAPEQGKHSHTRVKYQMDFPSVCSTDSDLLSYMYGEIQSKWLTRLTQKCSFWTERMHILIDVLNKTFAVWNLPTLNCMSNQIPFLALWRACYCWLIRETLSPVFDWITSLRCELLAGFRLTVCLSYPTYCGQLCLRQWVFPWQLYSYYTGRG